jgi:uncharacterized protein involved in response to NO
VATAPLWRSPFRPFFLLGALYGPVLLATWILPYTGLLPMPQMTAGVFPLLYHQHELVFGFSTAIIVGFIMTALPSWAGTAEISGTPLAILVASWALGRLAVALSPWLPTLIVAGLDLSFPVLLAALLGPGLRQVDIRYKLGLAVIIGGFFAGNLCYYLGAVQGDQALWSPGLRIGLYTMIFHCSVAVGLLAPIFTENTLAENGQPAVIGHKPLLEWLSALSILLLAGADTAGATGLATGLLALACCLLHLARLLRWRSFDIITTPIVWVLHLGFAWLCLALLLLAVDGLGLAIDQESWVHAFTIGGFGLMSLGLMTRVSLKHTGRTLRVPTALVLAYLLLSTAALVRVLLPLTSLRVEMLMLSGLLWVLPYLAYLLLCGPMLVMPSLPHQAPVE